MRQIFLGEILECVKEKKTKAKKMHSPNVNGDPNIVTSMQGNE